MGGLVCITGFRMRCAFRALVAAAPSQSIKKSSDKQMNKILFLCIKNPYIPVKQVGRDIPGS